MEITYIGHSCFKIKGKELSLLIDPYDPRIGYKFPKQECDVLLVTHDHFDHNYREGVTVGRLVIDQPGEYEVSGVFIHGILTPHDEKAGAERGTNIIFLVEIDGITLLHLGDLGAELADDILEKIPDVDVLMVPVGGRYTIDAEAAAKVISSIEPGIVVPMHYKTPDLTGAGVSGLGSLDEFLHEMGTENGTKKAEKLKLNSKSDAPEETEVLILQANH